MIQNHTAKLGGASAIGASSIAFGLHELCSQIQTINNDRRYETDDNAIDFVEVAHVRPIEQAHWLSLNRNIDSDAVHLLFIRLRGEGTDYDTETLHNHRWHD